MPDEFCLRLDQLTDQNPEFLFLHAIRAQNHTGRALLLHGKAKKKMLGSDHRTAQLLCRQRRIVYRPHRSGSILIALFHSDFLYPPLLRSFCPRLRGGLPSTDLIKGLSC